MGKIFSLTKRAKRGKREHTGDIENTEEEENIEDEQSTTEEIDDVGKIFISTKSGKREHTGDKENTNDEESTENEGNREDKGSTEGEHITTEEIADMEKIFISTKSGKQEHTGDKENTKDEESTEKKGNREDKGSTEGEQITTQGIGGKKDCRNCMEADMEKIFIEPTKSGKQEHTGDKEKTKDEESTEGEGSTEGEKITTEEITIRELFINQLKAKYKLLYDAVQPIPYIRDRLFCVDRVFVEGGIEYFDGSWLPLDSYHSVFSFRLVKGKRRILLGEPGYGKSTLTLQCAYDWCNTTGSAPLRNVEILIVLRLRQLGGVPSIYKAIKQFLLPRHSQISENDIRSVLEKCSSVAVILDGFDEYPDAEKSTISDVMKIILGKMFEQCEVILTTRYLPKQYKRETKRLRLIGFDDKARDKYIRKAVVGDDVVAAEKIKRRLQENPVLGDLCQVPLFFVMFAHMSHEDEEFQTFKTVTSFFQYMIKCFHSHMRNKMEDPNVQRYHVYEEDHRKLDKVAFEGLSKENQQIVWSRQELIYILGKEFYDQYITIGVLVEEEDLDNVDEYDTPSSKQHQREVRFYHKVFCEWYAAHYLAEYAAIKRGKLAGVLRYMDPLDLQYCYRFACGLNSNAASCIIEYVAKRKGGDKFAILCILEQGGRVEAILDSMRSLCTEKIKLNEGDNALLQRSTVQLLEIAACHEIPISLVYLINCYSTVDLRGRNHLQLKSNLFIPVLTTLNELWIHEEGREITSEEFTGILQYSSKCLALKELLLWYCLLPPFVQAESVSVLRSRNVKVIWWSSSKYQLDLQSCLWEYDCFPGRKMADEDYQEEVKIFREKYKKD